MKFFSQFSNPRHNPGEINLEPSLTIPDVSMSIPELIRRYASGLPLGAGKTPLYTPDDQQEFVQGVDLERMDGADKAMFLQERVQEYMELQKANKEKRELIAKRKEAEKAVADFKEAEQKRIESEKAAMQKKLEERPEGGTNIS